MSETVILVPRRSDGGHRDKLWDWAQEWWKPMGRIVEGDHTEGPFNRSAAVNLAAKLAGDWDQAIILDSDVIVDPHAVNQAVILAEKTQRIVFPFRTYKALNNKGAELVMEGFKGNWDKYVKGVFRDNRSACLVVPRSTWDKVGGFDERFRGWGWEDVAFAFATSAASGNYLRLSGDLWHLWHPRSAENNHQASLFLANRDLCHRYIEAMYSWEATKRILSEDGGPLS